MPYTCIGVSAPLLTMARYSCNPGMRDGCGGEMAGTPMWVHAETPDGTVLVDEWMTPMDNGFVELWLPRDSEIDLSIRAGIFAAEGRVTTYATSNTCITTFRLQ